MTTRRAATDPLASGTAPGSVAAAGPDGPAGGGGAASAGGLGAVARPQRTAMVLLQDLVARYGVLAALAAMVAWFSIARPSAFPTTSNWEAILEQASPLAVVAFGLTVPLAIGDFDLSIGGMMSLGSASTVALMAFDHLALVPALLVGLAVGAIGGAINGYAVSYLGASSFIITLASGQMMTGGQYVITKEATIFQGLPAAFGAMTSGLRVVVFAVVVAAVLWVVLERTEPGRYVYAIGSNREAARFAGLRVKQWRLASFVCVGFCASLGGILVASQAVSESPDLGTPYLLPTYAAVFLGSAMLRPGRFSLIGTAFGALFLQVLQTGLAMLSLSSAAIQLVDGGVLAAAILLSRLGRATARAS